MTDIILSPRTKRILDGAEYTNSCSLDIFAKGYRNATVWAHELDATIYGVSSSCPKDDQGNSLEGMACVTVPVDDMGLRPEIITSPDYKAVDNPTSDYFERRIEEQIREWRRLKVEEKREEKR